jgi:tetratricopeptide (TPR) repeat protein
MRSRRVVLLLALAVTAALALGTRSQSEHFGGYDPQKILIPADPATGKGPAVNVTYLDAWIDELAAHTSIYPPRFDSGNDKIKATDDLALLAGILDTLIDPKQPNVELLRRAAIVNSLEHNLDVQGAAQKANDYFIQLLRIAPDDTQGNWKYGVFLLGAGRPNDAMPYLLKAEKLGIVSATYSLGMAYLMAGDKQKAIEYLEKYHKAVPQDKSIDPLIENLKKGKFKVEKS